MKLKLKKLQVLILLKKLQVLILCILLPLLGFYTLAYAADDAGAIFIEYANIFQWFLGLAVLSMGFLLSRMITAMDKNNIMQWQAIAKLSNRMATLEGQHNAVHQYDRGGRRPYDPNERLD